MMFDRKCNQSREPASWALQHKWLNERCLGTYDTVRQLSYETFDSHSLRFRYNNGTFWVVTTLVYDHLAADDTSRWDNVSFPSWRSSCIF